MQRVFDERAMEATALLLVASVLLIGASLAGIGGGVPLVAVLALIAVTLAAGRERLPRPGRRLGQDLDRYVRDLWVAPALAAAASAFVFGATPAEIQTVGGLLGFVGMVNYFLRPVYHAGYSLAGRLVETLA
ncbi:MULTISPECIES: hypothetical protein [Halomicrobium]|uniref:Uncharacterized protein n=2 Tax=Halomicrobium mukohataei TaxID=57705 RepID=C7NZT5_HALMD|nr:MULTISPECIES: hypothetical protein [Halomicrobium]ACV46843.1 hypothetical protein Hmuk_0712 [Halomicrobium mukohataei DSM 12286]QCD65344.1 hypothetical protein E5139_06740 [Halomicrobium mukohataei]QFR20150.1 hypothetical protein GBQ70_06735 [Halomicrobium sp. ZPS1]